VSVLVFEERTYEDNELQKVNFALEIVEHYPDDKFLIFSHTKRTGEFMKKALQGVGIECEFHNADLEKKKRVDLEKKFKSDKDFRVIVATSTVAWGVNLPARRVIVLGIHRGLDEVATYDVSQMVGRSGRPAYDPAGDAYILLPERTFDMHKERLKKPQLVKSQMLEQNGGQYKILAFHIVSEIFQENIQTREDVKDWFSRSLACWQTDQLPDEIIDHTLDSLKKCGAVWEENGYLTVTSVGKIASMFYFSPFDVADLKKNFSLVFDQRKEDDDLWVSMALGNLDTHRFGIVSRNEREEMSAYANLLTLTFGKSTIWEPAIKASYVYNLLLNGANSSYLASISRNFQFDFPRLMQVLQALDGFGGRWGKKKWFDTLELRIKYGVKAHLVNLCQLPNVGKARAMKLWHAGIRSFNAVAANSSKVRSTLKLNTEKTQQIISEAKKLALFSF